jgi:hypothetical protein
MAGRRVKGLRQATEAGDPAQPNEDCFGATDDVLVLVDGAGTPAGSDSGCRHGVPWFVSSLGRALLDHCAPQRGLALVDALGRAIETVSSSHSETCDLQHPGTPSSTVVLVRDAGDAWEHLVLADSTLLLIAGGSVTAVTDDREAVVGRGLRSVMDALPTGSRSHTDALRRYVEGLRAYRNRPGGFWVAGSNPAAADEAITGTVARADVPVIALLSDGATRLVDRFGLATWPEVADVLLTDGPAALIRRVRDAERSDPQGRRWPRGRARDDATVAVCRLPSGSGSGVGALADGGRREPDGP